jgi:hypothetical protein
MQEFSKSRLDHLWRDFDLVGRAAFLVLHSTALTGGTPNCRKAIKLGFRPGFIRVNGLSALAVTYYRC